MKDTQDEDIRTENEVTRKQKRTHYLTGFEDNELKREKKRHKIRFLVFEKMSFDEHIARFGRTGTDASCSFN